MGKPAGHERGAEVQVSEGLSKGLRFKVRSQREEAWLTGCCVGTGAVIPASRRFSRAERMWWRGMASGLKRNCGAGLGLGAFEVVAVS